MVASRIILLIRFWELFGTSHEMDKCENISTHSHNFVTDEAGNLVFDENLRVVLTRISDGSLISVDQKIISKVFGIQFEKSVFEDQEELRNEALPMEDNVLSPIENYETLPMEDNVLSPIESSQANWSRESILKLIELFRINQHLFKNTAVRNDKVWGIIAKDLNKFTLDQCKNKFKYLKAKYVKAKDNMSDRNTGGKKISFDYFDEFEEIFAKDPNIEPVAIASCSGLHKNKATDEQKTIIQAETHAHPIEMATEESTPKKQKTSLQGKGKKLLFAKELKDLSEVLKEREKNKERRHKEMMEKKEESIAAFNKYLSFLMNKEKDT